MANTGPNIGQLALEIDLLDGYGERWMLSGARGKVVALFFYLGDETPVCTKQMCSVRDNWARYQQTDAEVVGASTDSVEKHRRFAANHKLPIRLLSDSARKTVRDHKMKNLLGTRRGVIVIGRDGVIRFRKVVMPIFRPTDDFLIGVGTVHLGSIEESNTAFYGRADD
jgi:peroxiredoxin Q/BCP